MMTLRDILIALCFTLISGSLTLFLHQLYLNRREKRLKLERNRIKFPNDERTIDEKIFTALCPGNSVELMRTVLGTPNRIFDDEGALFQKSAMEIGHVNHAVDEDRDYEVEPTNSFLYEFKNATVKITSRDKEIIDSLTVLPDDDMSFEGLILPDLPESDSEEDFKFGELKVTEEMAEICRPVVIRSMRDYSFGLSFYTAAPLYIYYTYFGVPDIDKEIDFENYQSKDFVGCEIDGVCISRDDTDAHYIWFGELV